MRACVTGVLCPHTCNAPASTAPFLLKLITGTHKYKTEVEPVPRKRHSGESCLMCKVSLCTASHPYMRNRIQDSTHATAVDEHRGAQHAMIACTCTWTHGYIARPSGLAGEPHSATFSRKRWIRCRASVCARSKSRRSSMRLRLKSPVRASMRDKGSPESFPRARLDTRVLLELRSLPTVACPLSASDDVAVGATTAARGTVSLAMTSRARGGASLDRVPRIPATPMATAAAWAVSLMTLELSCPPAHSNARARSSSDDTACMSASEGTSNVTVLSPSSTTSCATPRRRSGGENALARTLALVC
eukprot:m.1266303 g.1266303  ORF g.1266303 m.1266303 type:complete len:304 (+) comp24740_c0_seq15:269-1180(+)